MVSFEKTSDRLILYHDNAFGLAIKPMNAGYLISSRPLKKLLESIYSRKRVRFEIKRTLERGTFLLNPLPES